jgi:DNA-binding beta-propeller fold protein YncE
MRRFLSVLLMIVPAVVAAQEDEPRYTFKPVGMFNQHLYYGTFARPHSIAIDSEHNEVWVADTGNGLISVFRPDGAELYAFGSKDYIREPVRIAVAPKGEIAVLEGDRTRVRLFNYRGEYRRDLELGELGSKPIIGAVAYDASGNVYIGENRTGQIFVFSPTGKMRRQFGSRGTDDGQFQSICAIAIAADGAIYVADQQALAVQVFDNQGNFIRGWGRHEMGAEHFSLPSGLALHGDLVYVTDELRHQVKIFSTGGKLLTQFGGLGAAPGQISFPTDVAVDALGRIYVTERSTSRVQVFEMAAPKQ